MVMIIFKEFILIKFELKLLNKFKEIKFVHPENIKLISDAFNISKLDKFK